MTGTDCTGSCKYNYHTDTTTKIHLNKLNNNYIPEICHFIKIHAILQFSIIIFFFAGDDIKQITYDNVSVMAESTNLKKNEIIELKESQECINRCDYFPIYCVAAIFEHSTNSCYIYNVNWFENFHTKYTFLVELSTKETTFYYKSWQRCK